MQKHLPLTDKLGLSIWNHLNNGSIGQLSATTKTNTNTNTNTAATTTTCSNIKCGQSMIGQHMDRQQNQQLKQHKQLHGYRNPNIALDVCHDDNHDDDDGYGVELPSWAAQLAWMSLVKLLLITMAMMINCNTSNEWIEQHGQVRKPIQSSLSQIVKA